MIVASHPHTPKAISAIFTDHGSTLENSPKERLYDETYLTKACLVTFQRALPSSAMGGGTIHRMEHGVWREWDEPPQLRGYLGEVQVE